MKLLNNRVTSILNYILYLVLIIVLIVALVHVSVALRAHAMKEQKESFYRNQTPQFPGGV